MGAGSDDRLEADALRSPLAHVVLERESKLAFRAPDYPLAQQALERGVGQRARGLDPRDLVRFLDRAQGLDEPARGDEIDVVSELRAQTLMLVYGNVIGLEPQPELAGWQRFAHQVQQTLGRGRDPASERVIDLLRRLFLVAEIGDEHSQLGADQSQSVRSAVAGQVANVDQVGDQQDVDARLPELCRQALCAVAHVLESSVCSRSSASRYPGGPFPATCAMHSSAITECRRHSSRSCTSER